MNVLKFINSCDVREYLEKINYHFSASQAAWIISQSKNTAVKEKHMAWEKIISTSPDVTVNTLRDPPQIFRSLHKSLREYIDMENKIISKFYKKDSDAKYSYQIYIEDKVESVWHIAGEACLYDTYEECCLACIKDMEDNSIDICGLSHIVLEKIWEHGKKYITATFSSNFETMIDIVQYNVFDCSNYLNDLFVSLNVSIPLPFKHGDVVKYADCYQRLYGESECDLIVFDELTNVVDSYGYIGYGYTMDMHGQIFSDSILDAINLEYYHGEFEGKCRALKALSNYMKGNIDIGLYSSAYHVILTEEYAKDVRPISYNQNGMKLAGLV